MSEANGRNLEIHRASAKLKALKAVECESRGGIERKKRELFKVLARAMKSTVTEKAEPHQRAVD